MLCQYAGYASSLQFDGSEEIPLSGSKKPRYAVFAVSGLKTMIGAISRDLEHLNHAFSICQKPDVRVQAT